MNANLVRPTAVFFAAAVIAALITGCAAPPSKVIVASGYRKQPAADAVLAVVLLDDAPEVIYFGDVKKSLKLPIEKDGDTSASSLRFMVWDYFKEQLVRDLAKETGVKEAFIAEIKHNYHVTKEFFKTKDEDVIVEIPDIKTRFNFYSSEASHVLFLDRIRIGTETDPYYADRAQHGVYTGTPRKLLYLASFVLWDNRELKHIAYGRVKVLVPIVREEATAADWEEVSRDFVRMIFEPVGLVKREDIKP